MSAKSLFKHLVVAALAMIASSTAWAADGDPWSVSKSSGEVWLTTQGAQQVALGNDNMLKPGDTIRTGHNGRVLLTRGAETMLIAPNSVVGLPTDARDGMATTILQRAGSILLDVERRNVEHFEVETPYLAAVVKGTQFRVTIEAGHTKVDVNRGQVEVSDFKSGQIAQVTPGQSATSFASGRPGLHLSGSGSFAPIEQGRPRMPTIDRVPVPKGGLHAPREAKGSVIHAVGPVNSAPVNPAATQRTDLRQGATTTPKPHGVRISSSLGEVKLNVGSATHGLAHGTVPPGLRNGAHKSTMWGDNTAAGASNGSANSSATAGSDSTSPAAISATVSTAIGSASANLGSGGSDANNGIDGNGSGGNGGGNGKGKGNGNGNAYGNGNGNAYGNGNGNGNAVAQWLNYVAEKTHGNGNAYGLANGNNGNGNGNGKSKN